MPPHTVVGERDGRSAVGVDGVSQGAVVVIAVRRDNPASPGAGRELAVGSVGVRWPLPVGVDLVRDKPRLLVAEPARGVSTKGKITVRRHGYFGADLVHLFSLC